MMQRHFYLHSLLLLLLAWNLLETVESFTFASNRNIHTIVGIQSTRKSKTRALSSLYTSADDSAPPEQQVIEIETLSYGQLLELIELSFVQSCWALAQGDIEPLQLFIVAVQAALKHEKSMAQLIPAVPSSSRTLDHREQDLRATWMQAVGLLLQAPDLDERIVQTYAPVLDDLRAIQKTGLGLNAPQFVQSRKEIIFSEPNHNPLLLVEDRDGDSSVIDPVQMAIVTQTVKVLYHTLIMLEVDTANNPSPEQVSTGQNKKQKKKKSNSSGGGFGQLGSS